MTDSTPAGEHWLEHRVDAAEDGWQVREVLLRVHRLSRAMIRRLAQSRGVRLNGEVPFLSSPVRAGDRLRFRLSGTESGGLRPVPMELDVVWEDRHVLVVAKPPGILVHPTRRSHVRTLAHGVLAHLRQRGEAARPHPVHRLDRDTSGLVLFAKHSVAHQRLDRQLRARSLRRSYLAVVQGTLAVESGEVDAPISRNPDDPHLRSSAVREGASAQTAFRVRERFAAATLVEVELETGRTHQIRVHMAHLGHPLVGDTAYGGAVHAGLDRQALHAWRLRFEHPFSAESVLCEAALPADMARLLSQLRAREWSEESRDEGETRY